eukprot:TRINITY_DN11397_c0_g1_i2.p1 TRINITY_DN11397_c0_g1~~TRINITY_DN11397_c0_g1_i2.p1  ORF type:complete len:129 (-),score=38.56 TRINITY_DN11397_c0_g1_i2:15-401(-)
MCIRDRYMIIQKKATCRWLICLRGNYVVLLEGAKVSSNHKRTSCSCEHLCMSRCSYKKCVDILIQSGYFRNGMLDCRKPRNDKGSCRSHLQKSLSTLASNCDKKQENCLLYTSPSPRDLSTSRMPSSA